MPLSTKRGEALAFCVQAPQTPLTQIKMLPPESVPTSHVVPSGCPAHTLGVAVGEFVGVLVMVGVDVGVFVGVAVGVTVGVLVDVLVGVRVGVLVGVLVGPVHTPKPLPFLLLPGGGLLAPTHCRPGQQL